MSSSEFGRLAEAFKSFSVWFLCFVGFLARNRFLVYWDFYWVWILEDSPGSYSLVLRRELGGLRWVRSEFYVFHGTHVLHHHLLLVSLVDRLRIDGNFVRRCLHQWVFVVLNCWRSNRVSHEIIRRTHLLAHVCLVHREVPLGNVLLLHYLHFRIWSWVVHYLEHSLLLRSTVCQTSFAPFMLSWFRNTFRVSYKGVSWYKGTFIYRAVLKGFFFAGRIIILNEGSLLASLCIERNFLVRRTREHFCLGHLVQIFLNLLVRPFRRSFGRIIGCVSLWVG